MFPLAGGPWPSTVEQFQQQLVGGTRSMLNVTPRVAVSGGWPALSELALDLSGVRIDPALGWPEPRPAIECQDGPTIQRLQFCAAPLRWGDVAEPHFDLRASELRFEFMRDAAGRHWLRPKAVGNGSIRVGINEAQLNRLFLDTAAMMARAHGITVEDARITLEPAGPNALRLEAGIGARKLFLKGRLRFTGTAEVGPTLDVRLSELRCEGVGPIGALAARVVQPHLDRLSQQPVRPLGSLLSGLALEHFEFKHGDHGTLEFAASLAPVAAP